MVSGFSFASNGLCSLPPCTPHVAVGRQPCPCRAPVLVAPPQLKFSTAACSIDRVPHVARCLLIPYHLGARTAQATCSMLLCAPSPHLARLLTYRTQHPLQLQTMPTGTQSPRSRSLSPRTYAARVHAGPAACLALLAARSTSSPCARPTCWCRTRSCSSSWMARRCCMTAPFCLWSTPASSCTRSRTHWGRCLRWARIK